MHAQPRLGGGQQRHAPGMPEDERAARIAEGEHAFHRHRRGPVELEGLQEQIDYTASSEIVSSDLVGSRHAGVVDSKATIASDRNVVLYVWYDNEFGYSCQVVRIAQQMAGIHFLSFPA